MVKIALIGSLVGGEISRSYYVSYEYEKKGAYKEAIKSLKELYKSYPNGYTLNLRLGYLFFLDRKYKNSIFHYQKAALIAPYSIEARLGLARVYLKSKNYNKVIETTKEIIKQDFYNYYGNYYYLLALKGIGEFDKALEVANKMLSLYPTSSLYLTQIGELYFKKRDRKRASEVFKEVLILEPNNLIAKEYLRVR